MMPNATEGAAALRARLQGAENRRNPALLGCCHLPGAAPQLQFGPAQDSQPPSISFGPALVFSTSHSVLRDKISSTLLLWKALSF